MVPLLRRTPEVLLVLPALLLLFRIAVRDRLPVFSALYYGAPLPVLAAVVVAAALTAWALRRRRLALGSAASAFGLLLLFLGFSFRWAATAPAPGSFRGVFWNVSRGTGGWDRVASGLARTQPDLIAVGEGGPKSAGRDRLFEEALPGAGFRWFQRGMGLAIRGGRILGSIDHDLAGFGGASVIAAELRGRPVEIVLVDLDADPFESRAAAFDALARILAAPPAAPRLVLGDFNTPWESVHFDRWRSTMTQAFHEAGEGMSPTWPLPLPLIEIDHVWGQGIRFTRCGHEDLGASDHRAVVFEAAPTSAP